MGHFLTRFAHASQSTECPQGLNVTTVFVLQTKHWTDASREKKVLYICMIIMLIFEMMLLLIDNHKNALILKARRIKAF